MYCRAMSSKKGISSKVPANVEQEIKEYREANNVNTSEAVRQLIESGLDDWHNRGSFVSQTLLTAAKVSAVAGFLSSVIGFGINAVDLLAVGGMFSAIALVTGMMWAGLRSRDIDDLGEVVGS